MDIPTTIEEAEEAVWNHLKDRLAVRRQMKVCLGVPAKLPVKMGTQNGAPFSMPINCDITLDSDGGLLLAAIADRRPDELRSVDAQRGGNGHVLPLLLDAVNELVRLGVLRCAPVSPQYLFITHQGRAALDADDLGFAVVSDRRVAAFATEFSQKPDFDTIHRHLAEAVAAYRANLDLSATVMTGCCYEMALVQLVRSLATYQTRLGPLPNLNKKERDDISNSASGAYVAASRLEAASNKTLRALVPIHAEMKPFNEWIKGSLGGSFYLVRVVRNAAGHPSGQSVSRDEVATHIGLFNSFYRRLILLIAALDGL